MNLLALKIGIVGVLIVLVGVWHYMSLKAAVGAAKASVVAEYQIEIDKSVAKAIEDTKKLQESADVIKEKKYETLKRNNDKLLADIVSLQQRAKRPSPTNLAPNPSAREACTAAQLYREDAEFLAREAARADSVLIERNYYYEQYESIRKQLSPQ
jgi:hypothetical protein